MTDIKTSVLFECGKPAMVMMDYMINVSDVLKSKDAYNEEEVR